MLHMAQHHLLESLANIYGNIFEKDLFISVCVVVVCVYVLHTHVCSSSTHRGQKMASDPLELRLIGGCTGHGYWEPNIGPMQEQQVIL